MDKHHKKLRKFYKDLAKWIESGQPDHPVFRRSVGLCTQLRRWLDDLPWYAKLYYDLEEIESCQSILFSAYFCNTAYPFGGLDKYYREKNMGIMYRNPARLEFVFKHAGMEL